MQADLAEKKLKNQQKKRIRKREKTKWPAQEQGEKENKKADRNSWGLSRISPFKAQAKHAGVS